MGEHESRKLLTRRAAKAVYHEQGIKAEALQGIIIESGLADKERCSCGKAARALPLSAYAKSDYCRTTEGPGHTTSSAAATEEESLALNTGSSNRRA
jgi:hypothetical protein